jgi:hypothetical protein
MRMMLKITFPTEKASHAIKDGSFQKIMQGTMSKLKPEASYFLADKGYRCAMLFFDMQDASDIPAIVEPLFASLGVAVELQPVMNADDLQRGFSALAQVT